MNDFDIKLAVTGGDMRMLFCAKELCRLGFETSVFGFAGSGEQYGDTVRCATVADALSGASAVILPVPCSADGCRLNAPFWRSDVRIDDVLSCISPTQLVLGGVISQSLLDKADSLCLSVVDYMKDEELTVKNAVTTAEGALYTVLKDLPVTVSGLPCLVLGYGRVGKAVSDVFGALHADVTVCARRPDALAWARSRGHKTSYIGDICAVTPGKKLIINTVPELIVDNNVISFTDTDAYILDLASSPGGVDLEAAEKKGIKAVHALSLPGKTAPLTAGRDIAAAVFAALQKRGVV